MDYEFEVKTGLKTKIKNGLTISEKSELTRAVLFRKQKHFNDLDPEKELIQLQNLRILLEKLRIRKNISVADFDKLIQTGRVLMCGSHAGIFNKKKDGKLFDMCTDCMHQKIKID